MKNKYAFLLSLKSLEYEINQLNGYSKEFSDCYELLRAKLDALCQFMINEDNERHWREWSNHEEIRLHSGLLRETSIQALCDMEKFQSLRTLENKLNISEYISMLSRTVKEELRHFQIGRHSKVLFVGSGAFPLTALTIAKETNADVLCLDIDAEAVHLGRRVAEASGLESKVHFSGIQLKEQSYLTEATHVMIASLVGNKLEVLEDVKHVISKDAKIILRYGNDLKSIFNYPLEQDLSEDWDLTPIIRQKSIYDTLIIAPKKSLAKGR